MIRQRSAQVSLGKLPKNKTKAEHVREMDKRAAHLARRISRDVVRPNKDSSTRHFVL